MIYQTSRPIIHAFGKAIIARVVETTILEGELTRIIHFTHPRTGQELVTTRKVRRAA